MLRRIRRSLRSSDFTWRYLYNFAPTFTYRYSPKLMSEEVQRVTRDLNHNGVAITSVSRLLGVDSTFKQLASEVAQLEQQLERQLCGARTSFDDSSTIGNKSFLYMLLGDHPPLDPSGIYTRFALQEPVLGVANAYFGMYTRLRYYNVWHTFASQEKPRESQLWHRDREDRLILKMFVYLSDVNDGAGPLIYASGSHRKGKLRREPNHFLEGVVKRSTDEQMAEVVAKDKWIKCTGPKGTIVFADTAGYHKGGEARKRDRVMYTCMFTSPASESQELLTRSEQVLDQLDRPRAFALAPGKRGPWLRLNVGRQ